MTLENIHNPFQKLKTRYLPIRFFFISLVIGLILGFIQESTGIKFQGSTSTLVLYIIIFVSLCAWSLADFRRLDIKLHHVLGKIPKNKKWLPRIGLVVLLILFSISAYIVSFSLLSLIAPNLIEILLNEIKKSPSTSLNKSLLYNLFVFVVTVVIAPITEEFIFRGILLQRWSVKWGMKSALIVSSLLFGFAHANFLGLSIFGLVMGILYIETRSLYVPIACHALNNFIALMLGILSSTTQSNAAEISLQQIQSSLGGGLFLMAISLPLIVRFLWRNWPRKNTPIPYLSNRLE